MSKKPKLRVIVSPSECCTRAPGCKCKHSSKDMTCEWWINSKEHGYCFWKFLREKSSPDGVMEELVQSELAQLFGYSNTKTHFVLKEAIRELKEALADHGIEDLLDSGEALEDEESYENDFDYLSPTEPRE